MKATDLMIGDLAVVNKDGLCIKKNTIVEVRGIEAVQRLELDDKCLIGSAHCSPLDEEQFSGGIWCEHLDPIPLTAEILEKNGFVEHRDGFYATEQEQLAGDGFVVKNMVYYKSGTLSVVTERGEIGIGIKFIHQLQHALRLCGIEKEIVL